MNMRTLKNSTALFAILLILGCSENSRRFATTVLFGGEAKGYPAASGFASNTFCDSILGATFVAQDGTFLGAMKSELDQGSVLNEFGPHGNEFSAVSIWNEYGNYGSAFGSYSAFNEFASYPPLILINGQVAGHLSVSKSMRSAIHPYALKQCRY